MYIGRFVALCIMKMYYYSYYEKKLSTNTSKQKIIE